MIIITDEITPLCEVHCSCCRKSHMLTISKRDDDYLYLEFEDKNKWTLYDRISNSVKLLKNDNDIISGIILSNKQASELLSVLSKLIGEDGIPTIDKTSFIEKDDMIVLDISNSLCLLIDTDLDGKVIQSEINYKREKSYTKSDLRQISWNHILHKSNNYIAGDFDIFMDPKELITLLSGLLYIKENS